LFSTSWSSDFLYDAESEDLYPCRCMRGASGAEWHTHVDSGKKSLVWHTLRGRRTSPKICSW
jgi:hypothetical protein